MLKAALGRLWGRVIDVPADRYPDVGAFWRARALRSVLVFGIVVLLVLLPVALLGPRDPTSRRTIPTSLLILAISLGAFWMAGRGGRSFKIVGVVLISLYMLTGLAQQMVATGILDPNNSTWYNAVVLAALVLDEAGVLITAGVSIAGLVGMALLTARGLHGHAPPPVTEVTAATFGGISSVAFIAILLLLFRRLHKKLQDEAVQASRVQQEIEARARGLLELDALKTKFLANVSHEFRTPLTLSLGLIDEALGAQGAAPWPVQRERLLELRRQDGRLLKLINTLLAFSRSEAGRAESRFEPVDLASLTTDLCSQFRAAMERVGLRFVVDCPSLPEPVYVDRDMWEMIVLNLLSNALKFTLEGRVEVTLRALSGQVELCVRDTGVGIAEQDLPQLFRRFHQLRARRARSQEGTGIGLALTHDLVALHGGQIRAASVAGKGTTFTITLPLGSAHLPAERVASAASPAGESVAQAFVDEAMQWLPADGADGAKEDGTGGADGPADADGTDGTDGTDGERGVAPLREPHGPSAAGRQGDATPAPDASVQGAQGVQGAGAHILLVEDNHDLRRYLRRLLGAHWSVSEAENGAEALRMIREQKAAGRDHGPDLVLSDVMMPVRSGFELVRDLRGDPELRSLPVLLLSARADEDSALRGLAAGANDYLVKPFLPRELVARISVQLFLSRLGRETLRSKEEMVRHVAHELRSPLTLFKGYTELLTTKLKRVVPGGMDMLPKMSTAVVRMEGLINDMVDAARLEAGRFSVERARCDLRALCIEAVDGEESLPGQHIDLSTPDFPVMIDADADRITQVLSNLLRNAFKYAGTDSPVRLVLSVQGDSALVEVSDQGPGIAPEHQQRIFDSFYQVGDSQSKRGTGLGLGLYICRELIARHDGSIWVESTPGQGSRFRFRLPLSGAGQVNPSAGAGSGS